MVNLGFYCYNYKMFFLKSEDVMLLMGDFIKIENSDFVNERL